MQTNLDKMTQVQQMLVPKALVQKTLAQEFVCRGVGLHSGLETEVKVRSADPGEGRYFVRVDLPDKPRINARVDNVDQTVLSTELLQAGARVRTVEHLLAALAGMGVSNACIEIDGPEVPLLDGSAQVWVEAIADAGVIEQKAFEPVLSLKAPLWVQDADAFVVGFPASQTRLGYEIDFPQLPAIGNQHYSLNLNTQSFKQNVAPARTFGFAEQVEHLRSLGLIQGGSLDNALVCDREGWLNPPLRFDNEPVRHKLLDLIGDLSLLGALPQGHILAYKASHKLHTEFATSLVRNN